MVECLWLRARSVCTIWSAIWPHSQLTVCANLARTKRESHPIVALFCRTTSQFMIWLVMHEESIFSSQYTFYIFRVLPRSGVLCTSSTQHNIKDTAQCTHSHRAKYVWVALCGRRGCLTCFPYIVQCPPRRFLLSSTNSSRDFGRVHDLDVYHTYIRVNIRVWFYASIAIPITSKLFSLKCFTMMSYVICIG